MVVAATDYSKAMSDPIQAIQQIFEKEGDKPTYASSVSSHFGKLFESHESRSKIIPVTRKLLADLESSSGQPSRLVRWQCMIQDTNLGSELMPRRFKDAQGSWKNGLFGASSFEGEGEGSHDVDISPSELASINTLYGVSIPGQSAWSSTADETLDTSRERSLVTQLEGAQLGNQREQHGRNFGVPSKLPTGDEMGVLLKVYDEDLAESVRVAQLVDVIGVLDQCTLSSGTADWSPIDEGHEGHVGEGESSSSVTNASTALHPAIHVICMNKASDQIAGESDAEEDTEQLRRSLIAYLAQGLQGDELAAEYVLLSLIARIHTRTATHTLGSLSLNLSSFPPSSSSSSSSSSGRHLKSLLSDILPSVVDQSLDLRHLNDANTQFGPRSSSADDGAGTGLQAGRLQLPDGTLLLIDESSMQEGQLRENGIANIRTLSNLLTTHKLTYAFPYSNLEMDADVPCIIFSQGKSFLPFDVQLPLDPSSSSAKSSSSNYNDESAQTTATTSKSRSYGLLDYRQYLHTAQTRSSNAKFFSITGDVSDQIQTDFVESRNQRKKKSQSSKSTPSSAVRMDTQEDLSRVLHLARLLCLSKGGRQLSWQDWQEAKTLDGRRLQRLNADSAVSAGKVAS